MSVVCSLMKCPFCEKDNTKVIDSRPTDDDSSIRRRRSCDSCGERFTTYEKIEVIPLFVVKKDQTRELFDRTKIEAGICSSCHKRPISAGQVSQMVDEIEAGLFDLGEKEIQSQQIGEMLMDKLKRLDAVAYVRFASVYREFKDVNTFMEEIKKIMDDK